VNFGPADLFGKNTKSDGAYLEVGSNKLFINVLLLLIVIIDPSSKMNYRKSETSGQGEISFDETLLQPTKG
jgi:hypothetical protein